METDLKTRHGLAEISHALLCRLQRTSRTALNAGIERYRKQTPRR